MKQKLLLILTLLITLPSALRAFTVDGLKYDPNLDGTGSVCVSGYEGNPMEIIIPETVTDENEESYLVTSICASAFQGCKSLISVKLPETITSIDPYAFSGCSSLSSITFSESLISIREYAFSDCESLISLTFPGSLTSIGKYAFRHCQGLRSITLPEGLTSIGEGAFADLPYLMEINYNCKDATIGGTLGGNMAYSLGLTLNIGEGVENYPDCFFCIGSLSFYQGLKKFASRGTFETCENITVYISDIDEWAVSAPTNYAPKEFWYSLGERHVIPSVNLEYKGKSLKNVTLGSKVEKIAPYAFAYSSIESVKYSEYLTEIGDYAFVGLQFDSVDIPEGVTYIGDEAFARNKMLQDVNLPEGLTYLGSNAFNGCTALYEVEIPSSLSVIKESTFSGCLDLEKVTFNEGLTAIEREAFYNCGKLQTPSFPQSLEKIGNRAFAGRGLFTGNIKFGKALQSIDSRAFECNKSNEDASLTLEFENGITSIGARAFQNQPIRKISLPESLETIGSYAFAGTKISDVTVPKQIKALNPYVFANMPSLYSAVLPEGLEEIGNGAFENSPAVKISIPSTVESIGDNAFFGTSLFNCEIPDGVTSIGANIFSNLNYLKLGTGIRSISQQIASDIDVLELTSTTPPTLGTNRLGCTPKIVIVPEGSGDTYKNSNRWKDYTISARNSQKAVVYLNEPGTLATECRIQTGIMPALVTNLSVEGEINDDDLAVMRSNMTSCYSIDLSRVTNKGLSDGAFSGKSTLLEMTLPSGLESIGNNAFNGCKVMHLKGGLPETLETIGKTAFNYCQSMDNDLEFPSTMKSVGKGAFQNCYSIKSADFSECLGVSFAEGDTEGYYPNYVTGVFSNCRSLESVVLPPDIDRIPTRMFSRTGLRAILLPKDVKEIGSYAFSTTSNMTSAVFPQSLERIEDGAFSGSGIEGADLPASLSSLGQSAFANSSLVYVNFSNGLAEIPDNAFANCPLLMVANMPNTLEALGNGCFSSPSLAAITSPSVTPASTNGAPFTGVDNYTCSLSIPKPSYSKYLSAEYWGAFVDIRNCIDVTLPTPPASGSESGEDMAEEEEEVEVTYMDEEDYQDMIEEEEENGDESGEEENPSSTRRRSLRVLSRAGMASASKGYGRAFNGASIYAADNSQTRFFINIPDGFENLKVMYNGKDVTDQIDPETNSFVTSPLTSVSTLVISGKYLETGVGPIIADEATAPVYTLTGAIAGYGKASLDKLPAGIYIFCGRKVAVQ